jgi:hypothetical protein
MIMHEPRLPVRRAGWVVALLALAAHAGAQPVPRGPEVTLYGASTSTQGGGTLVA